MIFKERWIGNIKVEYHHSGLVLSKLHKGYFEHQLYVGYTQREALRLFRAYLKEC